MSSCGAPGSGPALRVVAVSLLPIAAYLTGAIEMLWKIGVAIGQFGTGFAFSTTKWVGHRRHRARDRALPRGRRPGSAARPRREARKAAQGKQERTLARAAAAGPA